MTILEIVKIFCETKAEYFNTLAVGFLMRDRVEVSTKFSNKAWAYQVIKYIAETSTNFEELITRVDEMMRRYHKTGKPHLVVLADTLNEALDSTIEFIKENY